MQDEHKGAAMPEATQLKQKRWFSTGFMVGGVGSVDAEKHTLTSAVMIRTGEAKGHGMWIDQQFCADVMAMANAAGDKGLKARFGHPNMCSEALGTFLGRWKGFSIDASGKVMGNLYLSSTASESPKGDLRKYVEEMAAKEPDHFGASIVFTRNEEMENEFMCANGHGTETGFKSPDPANVQNLPHARCAELHAADLVDDPAATDGMFSGIGGASLAAQMTEWLDLHPQVLQALNSDPGLVDIVERYADQLKPFLSRYNANKPVEQSPAAESATSPVEQTPAEPDAMLTAEIATLKTLLSDGKTETERLSAELETVKRERETALANVATAEKAHADAMTALQKAQDEVTREKALRVAAEDRLKAMEKGAAPVSAGVAELKNEVKESAWKRAQRR